MLQRKSAIRASCASMLMLKLEKKFDEQDYGSSVI